jgi:hypothetical protein
MFLTINKINKISLKWKREIPHFIRDDSSFLVTLGRVAESGRFPLSATLPT